MAERAGAAVDIDLVMRQIEIAHRRHGDDREGLVDLEQIDLAELPARLFRSFRIAPIGAVAKRCGSCAWVA